MRGGGREVPVGRIQVKEEMWREEGETGNRGREREKEALLIYIKVSNYTLNVGLRHSQLVTINIHTTHRSTYRPIPPVTPATHTTPDKQQQFAFYNVPSAMPTGQSARRLSWETEQYPLTSFRALLQTIPLTLSVTKSLLIRLSRNTLISNINL